MLGYNDSSNAVLCYNSCVQKSTQLGIQWFDGLIQKLKWDCVSLYLLCVYCIIVYCLMVMKNSTHQKTTCMQVLKNSKRVNCGYVMTGCCVCQYECIENRWYVTFKCMLWFKYIVHVNFANSNRSTIHFHILSYLLEVNSIYWLSQVILGLWWTQLKTKVRING